MPQPAPQPIALVVSDVDGTLVTPEKVITPRAKEAVDNLRRSGIRFTITSSRPPRGLKRVIEELKLTDPIPAFNGGVVIQPDFSVVLHETLMSREAAVEAVEIIEAHKVDAWVYNGGSWLVKDRQGPHVERETHTSGFEPIIVASFGGKLDRVAKIVAVTDDFPRMQECEAVVHAGCGNHVSATLSQKYYLDITHPHANKGRAVAILGELLHIPIENIATIGDGSNDVLMFENSGFSIAMGNASPEVQKAAQRVTSSNKEDGFARAMEEFILAGVTK